MINSNIKPKPNIIKKPITAKLSVPKTHILPIVKSKGIVHLLTRITLAKDSEFKKRNDIINVQKYSFTYIFLISDIDLFKEEKQVNFYLLLLYSVKSIPINKGCYEI